MSVTSFAFVVHGPPVPKGRPRMWSGGHAYTPKRTRDYEARVKDRARASVPSDWPKDKQYSLTIKVYRHTKRGDLDNFVKAVSDALNGIAWTDDRGVMELYAVMDLDRVNPRTEVWVDYEE